MLDSLVDLWIGAAALTVLVGAGVAVLIGHASNDMDRGFRKMLHMRATEGQTSHVTVVQRPLRREGPLT